LQIIDAWFRDIPQQFLEKHNISVLICAFSKQLQEIGQVFEELNIKTDLNYAIGQNLDYVGTIIPLTRKEAGELAKIGISEPVISDERYRQILKYQLLRNTSDCTYYDIMSGLEYLYNFKFYYREDLRYPATIILNMPIELDKPDLVFYRGLCIKPSGVKIIGEKKFLAVFLMPIRYENEITFICGFYPRYNIPVLFLDGEVSLDGSYLLNGYLDEQIVDFYPLQMQAVGEVRKKITWSEQIGLWLSTVWAEKSVLSLGMQKAAEQQIYFKSNRLYLSVSTFVKKGIKEQMVFQSETEVPLEQEVSFFENGEAKVETDVETNLFLSGGIEEKVSIEEQLTVEKDLWFLDGTYLLDGEKLLDAEIFYYKD